MAKTGEIWSHKLGVENRKVTKIHIGDQFMAHKLVTSNIIRYYIPSSYDRVKGKFNDDRRVKMMVTRIHPYYIEAVDKSTGMWTSFSLGDLVVAGLEPEFLGVCKEEHMIKPPFPIEIKSNLEVM